MATKKLQNNFSRLSQLLKHDEYVFITKNGKPIGVAVPLTDESLKIGLTRAMALQAWRNGDISLGKMAELLQMDKQSLRNLLSTMNLAVINYPANEVSSEANFLLYGGT